MPIAVSSTVALPQRRRVRSRGAGAEHWCTDFIGRHAQGESTDGPETFLIEMSPNETILPHFHEVDQFQVFLQGAGCFGRRAVPPLAVHYVDRYTGYGPIRASARGYSYFVMHAERDPGAVYRHRPGYHERMRPGRKRNRLVHGVALSTAPVLGARAEPELETLLGDEGFGDGLGAGMLRLGPGMEAETPHPQSTGGQFVLVVSGNLLVEQTVYGPWSPVFVGPDEPALRARAGPAGLEVLVLSFPHRKGTA